MTTEHLSPAEYAVAAFGRQSDLRKALEDVTGDKVYDSTISRWRNHDRRQDPRSGLIPAEWQRPLLEAAKLHKRPIKAENIILGGTRAQAEKGKKA